MDQLIVFALGLCVGSFLNVLADRLPVGRGVWVGRSECDFCHRPLSWFELIPIISFLLLGGRCRRCHHLLSWQYPLVETATGLGFLWLYRSLPPPTLLISAYLIFSALLVITVADFKYQIIPDSMVFVTIIGAFWRLWEIGSFSLAGFLPYVLTALAAASFFLILWILTRGQGIGLGDVKLSLALGLILGSPLMILALYISFLTGALYGVILILTGRKSLKSRIAFGPFLVLATGVTTLWGEAIWQWVMRAI